MTITSTTSAALFALGAIAASLPATAQQEAPRYYAGGHFGTSDLDRWNAQVRLGAAVRASGHVGLDGARQAGLRVGRQSGPGRYEVEYQHGTFDLTSIQLGPVAQDATGGGRYRALTFNAYRVARFDERLNGHLGLGLGWGSASLPQAAFDNGCRCFSSASKDGWAAQLRAGLEYRFDGEHHVFLQYSVLSLPGPSSGGDASGVSYSRKVVGTAGLGYRKLF